MIERSVTKDGKVYNWKCPNRCKCKKIKFHMGWIQRMEDCERNPTIEAEEIEI